MRLATIVAIAAGDVAGIAVLFVVVLYVYQVRKRRQRQEVAKQRVGVVFKKPEADESPDAVGRSLSCCLRKKAGDDSDDTDQEVTDTSASFAAKEGITDEKSKAGVAAASNKKGGDGAVLVTVDGGAELELETLLKASAYILGAAGSSIVYKAVLADGAALAVRRIGSDCAGVRRFSELDAQMRAVAKLRHDNILRLRGFYWGPDEMLIIHDFAVNGNLANLSIKSTFFLVIKYVVSSLYTSLMLLILTHIVMLCHSSIRREAGVIADQPRVERSSPHRARRGERPRVPPRQEVGARQREAKQYPAGRGYGAAAGRPRRGPAGPRRVRRAEETVGGDVGGAVREQAFGQEPPGPVAAAQPRRHDDRAISEPGRGHSRRRHDGSALPGARGREKPQQGERQVGRVLVRRAAAGAGGRARAVEPGAVPVRGGGEGAGAGAPGGGSRAARRDGRAGGGGGELPPAGRRVLRHGTEQEAVHQGRAAGHGEDTCCRCGFLLFVVDIHGSTPSSVKKKHVLRWLRLLIRAVKNLFFMDACL
jgi:hypothetical protein